MRRARPWWWFCTTSTSPPATPITSLPCAGAGPCIREPRSRSSVTRCCAISTRWISACTRSTGSGSACTFEWAEAGRRAPGPGANGAGGFRTEAVLLQQVPISALALSLQEHPPRVRINWVLRLLVHCCGGACAILLRLGNHPVTEPLQGRRLGLALGNDQIIGVAAVDAVIVGDHQSAALQLAADQERPYQRPAHSMP